MTLQQQFETYLTNENVLGATSIGLTKIVRDFLERIEDEWFAGFSEGTITIPFLDYVLKELGDKTTK